MFHSVSEFRRACFRQARFARAVLLPGALFRAGAFALPPCAPKSHIWPLPHLGVSEFCRLRYGVWQQYYRNIAQYGATKVTALRFVFLSRLFGCSSRRSVHRSLCSVRVVIILFLITAVAELITQLSAPNRKSQIASHLNCRAPIAGNCPEFRGPRMGGWIPQKRQIQPRRIQPPILGPLTNRCLLSVA